MHAFGRILVAYLYSKSTVLWGTKVIVVSKRGIIIFPLVRKMPGPHRRFWLSTIIDVLPRNACTEGPYTKFVILALFWHSNLAEPLNTYKRNRLLLLLARNFTNLKAGSL